MATPEGGGFDWMHAASALGGALVGAGTSLIAGIWRLARIEPEIRAELSAIEKRIEDKIEAAEKRDDEKLNDLVKQFAETFAALRQKINDGELYLEREFLRKEDYKTLRDEDRANFAKFEARFFKEWDDFKRNIATIVGRT